MKSGLKIKELRESKGFKLFEFADKLGVTRQTLSSWEKSKPFPKTEELDKICFLFDVDHEYFEVEEEINHAKELIEELRATLDFVKIELAFMKSEMSKATEQNTMLVKALTGNFPENSEQEVPDKDNVKVIQIWPAIQNAG